MKIDSIDIKNKNSYYMLSLLIKVPFYKNSNKYANKVFDELYNTFEKVDTFGLMWSWVGYEQDIMNVNIYFSNNVNNTVEV